MGWTILYSYLLDGEELNHILNSKFTQITMKKQNKKNPKIPINFIGIV